MYFCRRKVVKDFDGKILRGKQVKILYSTRCCEFRERKQQNATVERREGAVFGTSQKTCHLCVVITSGGKWIQVSLILCSSFLSVRSICLTRMPRIMHLWYFLIIKTCNRLGFLGCFFRHILFTTIK